MPSVTYRHLVAVVERLFAVPVAAAQKKKYLAHKKMEDRQLDYYRY